MGMVDPKPSPEELASVIGRAACRCMAENDPISSCCSGQGQSQCSWRRVALMLAAAAVADVDEVWVGLLASMGCWRQRGHLVSCAAGTRYIQGATVGCELPGQEEMT